MITKAKKRTKTVGTVLAPQSAPMDILDTLSVDLYNVRQVKNRSAKDDKDLTKTIKGEMHKRKIDRYDGTLVKLSLDPTANITKLDTDVVMSKLTLAQLSELVKMGVVSFDKEKTLAYIKEQKIDLPEHIVVKEIPNSGTERLTLDVKLPTLKIK